MSTLEQFEKLKAIVLLRLMVSKTSFTSLSDLKKDVGSLLPKVWSDADAKSHLLQVLEALVQENCISRNKFKSSAITDQGRQQVLNFLQLTQWPADVKWPTIKTRYLPALALQVNLKSPSALQSVAGADDFRKAALQNAFDIDLSGKPTLIKVIDTVLAKHLKPAKSGIDALRAATVRNWLESDAKPETKPPKPVEPVPEPEPPFNSQAFIRDVLTTARSCPAGWFGDNKVFISHVWKKFKSDHPEYHLNETRFKSLLADLMRGHLSRADLVSVMNPQDVTDSEVRYLNARFHFIRVERSAP